METQRTRDEKQPILSIRGLSKRLGGRPILDGISLDVYPGEIYGFLGPNGSGKTTTIKLMLGLLRIDEGTITICGHSITDAFEAAVANVGGIIENPEMYKYLTGRENLEQYARMSGNVPPERIDEVVALVGLTGRINEKISRYSLGMRQRLGVAQALLHHPRLLVLDEPTNGLDPAGIKDLRDILKTLSRTEGVAVFVSSHLLAELEQMCDRVGVIDRGHMVGERTMAEMQGSFSDGKERLTVVLSDPKKGLELAKAAGFYCTADKNGIVVLTERVRVPELVRVLAPEVDVYEVSVSRKSLETAFLEMVGGSRHLKGEVPAASDHAESPISTEQQEESL